MGELLARDEVKRALETDLPDWEREGDAIARSVRAGSFLGGIDLVQRVAQVAEEHNHHPDIDIRWTTVTFRLSTHSEGGITDNDLRLAAEIDRLVG